MKSKTLLSALLCLIATNFSAHATSNRPQAFSDMEVHTAGDLERSISEADLRKLILEGNWLGAFNLLDSAQLSLAEVSWLRAMLYDKIMERILEHGIYTYPREVQDFCNLVQFAAESDLLHDKDLPTVSPLRFLKALNQAHWKHPLEDYVTLSEDSSRAAISATAFLKRSPNSKSRHTLANFLFQHLCLTVDASLNFLSSSSAKKRMLELEPLAKALKIQLPDRTCPLYQTWSLLDINTIQEEVKNGIVAGLTTSFRWHGDTFLPLLFSARGSELAKLLFENNIILEELTYNCDLQPLLSMRDALESGLSTRIQLVARNGGDLNEFGTNSMPLIIRAAILQQHEFAEWLLQHGAHVNLADDNGETALHHAATRGDWKLATLFFSHGALLISSNSGKTPFDVALTSGRFEFILHFLLKAKQDPILWALEKHRQEFGEWLLTKRYFSEAFQSALIKNDALFIEASFLLGMKFYQLPMLRGLFLWQTRSPAIRKLYLLEAMKEEDYSFAEECLSSLQATKPTRLELLKLAHEERCSFGLTLWLARTWRGKCKYIGLGATIYSLKHRLLTCGSVESPPDILLWAVCDGQEQFIAEYSQKLGSRKELLAHDHVLLALSQDPEKFEEFGKLDPPPVPLFFKIGLMNHYGQQQLHVFKFIDFIYRNEKRSAERELVLDKTLWQDNKLLHSLNQVHTFMRYYQPIAGIAVWLISFKSPKTDFGLSHGWQLASSAANFQQTCLNSMNGEAITLSKISSVALDVGILWAAIGDTRSIYLIQAGLFSQIFEHVVANLKRMSDIEEGDNRLSNTAAVLGAATGYALTSDVSTRQLLYANFLSRSYQTAQGLNQIGKNWDLSPIEAGLVTGISMATNFFLPYKSPWRLLGYLFLPGYAALRNQLNSGY